MKLQITKNEKENIKISWRAKTEFYLKKKKSRLVADHARPKTNPGHNGIILSINLQKIGYPRILSPTNWFFLKNEGKIHAFSDKERMRVSPKEPFNEPSDGCASDSKSVM